MTDIVSEYLRYNGLTQSSYIGMRGGQKLRLVATMTGLHFPRRMYETKKAGNKTLRLLLKDGFNSNQVRKNYIMLFGEELHYSDHDVWFARSKGFYQSQKWRNLRYKAIERSKGCCDACGDDGVLHVDHIFPRSIYPQYALQLVNMQVLCEDCNQGKGNVHIQDFRTNKPPIKGV